MQDYKTHIYDYVPPGYYDKSIRTNLLQRFWHSRRFKEVEKISQKIDGKILDIGSSDGLFTEKIKKYTQCPYIIGIDVLEDSVDYANKIRGNDYLKFITADAHTLPFENSTFSAVYSIESLEHCVDIDQILKEVSRVLSPQGIFIVLVPSNSILFRIIWFLWTSSKGKVWKHAHLHTFSGKSLPILLEKHNFKILEKKSFLLGMLLLIKAAKQ